MILLLYYVHCLSAVQKLSTTSCVVAWVSPGSCPNLFVEDLGWFLGSKGRILWLERVRRVFMTFKSLFWC